MAEMRKVRIGISPCPNDTFLFHGLLTKRVASPGVELDFLLADVQELNQGLARGELDVAKSSFFAALAIADRVTVLPVGSAIGFGTGPIVLASPARRSAHSPTAHRPRTLTIPRDARVLCPGAATTAHLLYRAFHPGEGVVEHVRFSEIMPALARGTADYGVCIHEGRFTWKRAGLDFVEDLGARWEAHTKSPLPLGGIVARSVLDDDVLRRVCDAMRESLDHAYAHRDEVLATMRAHAQDQDDAVLWAHVELYVNEWTRDLGLVGRRALDHLASLARSAELLPPKTAALEIWSHDPATMRTPRSEDRQ